MGPFYQAASLFVGGMQPYAPRRGCILPAASSFSGSLSDVVASSESLSAMDCVCNSDTFTVISFGFSAALADTASSSDAYIGGTAAPKPPLFSRARSAAMQSILSTWWKPVVLLQIAPIHTAGAGPAPAQPHIPYERAWLPTVLSAWQPPGIYRRP